MSKMKNVNNSKQLSSSLDMARWYERMCGLEYRLSTDRLLNPARKEEGWADRGDAVDALGVWVGRFGWLNQWLLFASIITGRSESLSPQSLCFAWQRPGERAEQPVRGCALARLWPNCWSGLCATANFSWNCSPDLFRKNSLCDRSIVVVVLDAAISAHFKPTTFILRQQLAQR